MARFVELNLNRLYSPEKPDPTRILEYIDKAMMIIGYDHHEEAIVTMTGTAPLWLSNNLSASLRPWVEKLEIVIEGTVYEIQAATATTMITKPKRRKKP